MMGMGNLTLNIMSLGGLALGVGLLIDNSIVMLENIFRHREGWARTRRRRPTGRRRGASPSSRPPATNLAAVVPFLLISGLTALIFRELILTISFAILASLPVALTLVPMLSRSWRRSASGGERAGEQPADPRLRPGDRPPPRRLPPRAPARWRCAGAGPCWGSRCSRSSAVSR
jgi:multidrug efflux pump subunit AcrB